MNRPAHVLVLTAVLLVPAAARAQSLSDAGDGSAPGDASSEFAPVTPAPDAAATSATDGCDGLMLNAPCTLLGAAGFCFPDGVDGSDSDLECVVDSGSDTGGCNVAVGASSAGTAFGLAALFGLTLAVFSRTGRRRRK